MSLNRYSFLLKPLLKPAQTYSKLPKPEHFAQDASQAVLLTVHVSESRRQAKVKTGGLCRKQDCSLPHTTMSLPTGSVDASIALVTLQEPLPVSRAGSPSESTRTCRFPLVTARRHGPPCRAKVELWDQSLRKPETTSGCGHSCAMMHRKSGSSL